MKDETICIVEDERDIIQLLQLNLEQEGYDIIFSQNGNDALKLIEDQQPNLILLDLMIPGKDGFEVCKSLKSNPKTQSIPIIMVTAKSQESHIITGLELGADDYITKPFSMDVLIARVRAAIRRTKHDSPLHKTALTFEDLIIYPDEHEVTIAGEEIVLNHSELSLLVTMAEKPNRVFSRSQLIDCMRGEDYFVTDRLVDVMIVSLRKKLKSHSKWIQTVRGAGYKFKPK